VRRLNITNFDVISPLDPPHYDTVTSLGILKDKLISGSRGNDLKLWNINPEFKGDKQIYLNYGNDGINSIKSIIYIILFLIIFQAIELHNSVYCGTNKGKINVYQL
jgi:hypothetical protein